ncbi:GIY-YIG nuclease family protein [Pedobacter sp. P351]|uniref:GIY-YIG nuclease family protein n=1 Tax=Pedobacter superstes TaxID=3133441 RepID=UPI0030B5995C
MAGLQCSDGSYYVGVTNDVERRLWEHQNGLDPKSYTFKKRPVQLMFVEYFQDATQAIEFEKQIKGWRRAKKEALIKREWDKLPELSVSYQSRLR